MKPVSGGPKRVAVTKRCAWCGKVKVGGAWIEDRRRPTGERYTHGICEACRASFLAEAARD